MVKAIQVDSPQQVNIEVTRHTDAGCYSSTGPLEDALGHTRTISSSGSSQASSSATSNLAADWGSVSTTSIASSISSSGAGEPKLKWNKSDLSNSSESSEDCGDDGERIKLLCGDDPEDWPDMEPAHNVHLASPQVHVNRRRKIYPKLAKILHKVRRKLNWQLMLLLTLILVVAISTSQLNDYRHSSLAIAGWDVNTTRDAAVYLLPKQHTALLEPRVVDRQKRYLLLVIVCSAVENFQTRQAIRQTWANGTEFNYGKYFNRMHSHASASYAETDYAEMRRVGRQLFGDDNAQLQRQHGRTSSTDNGAHDADKGHLIDRLGSQVIFLVGRPQLNDTQQLLVEESNTFGDLIQEDFIDTYNNLTLKSLMLLKWISNFNGDADRVKYVMKCDDDTFLNVPNLMHVLMGGTVPIYEDTLLLHTAATITRTSWTDSTSLMGFLFRNARPIRDITSKWYAPRFMYRRKIFPNYLSGTGYVIEATSTAKELFRAAMRTPIFHLEDVYVTGLCASRDRSTKPHHNPLFSFLRYAKRKCALRGMITQHPLTASDIRRAYDRLTNDSIVCAQPEKEAIQKILHAKSGAWRRVTCNWQGLLAVASMIFIRTGF